MQQNVPEPLWSKDMYHRCGSSSETLPLAVTTTTRRWPSRELPSIYYRLKAAEAMLVINRGGTNLTELAPAEDSNSGPTLHLT